MTPTKQRKQQARMRTRNRCKHATRFVNSFELPNFLDEYKESLRPGLSEQYLRAVGESLRSAWDKTKWESVGEQIEEIFRGYRKDILDSLKPGEALVLPLDSAVTAFAPPALRCLLGVKDSPIFKPRDELDKIAYAILQASQHGLLRMCEGHRNALEGRKGWEGWVCPTPFLVADEGRTRFCYESCGKHAKAVAKKNPKKGRNH
jgi:hypothetical protein